MPSLIRQIFSFVAARKPPVRRSSGELSARQHGTSLGGQRTRARPTPQLRGDFSYSDTSTWTFPHQAVSSSNLRSVAYDFNEQVLEIKFTEASRYHSATYRYSSVPLAVYQGLMAAPSKGKFHWSYIRDNYPYADVG